MRHILFFFLAPITFLFLSLTIFGLNILQVASIPLYLISKTLTRKINEALAYFWWGSIVIIMRDIYRMDIVFSGDKTLAASKAILIANHQSMVDIPALLCLGLAKKTLGGFKWCVKDAMRYVPGVGWGMVLLRMPFLSRNWNRDRKRMQRVFSALLEDKMPYWLLLFVEGTRFSPKKLNRSQNYSRESRRPILRHLLGPRVKGFVASFQTLEPSIDAVYDVTIGFSRKQPNLVDLFYGRVRAIHLHVRRFSPSDLPLEEQSLSDWIWNVYREKDELLEYFYRHGHFEQLDQ